MKRIMVVCAIILCIPALCLGEGFKVSNTFQAGQTIEAEKFNKNFKDIEEEIANLRNLLKEVERNMIPKETLLEFLPIGTIIPSMAELIGINSKMEKYFIPCDGRLIPTTSEYFKMVREMNISDKLKLRVPDLRGQFIRGLNSFGDSEKEQDDDKKDPHGDNRKVGDFQPDTFQGHQHNWKTRVAKDGSGGGSISSGAYNSTKAMDYLGVENTEIVAFRDFGQPNFSSETRPKNVAVYYYIKIN